MFLECQRDKAVETEQASLSWSEMSLLQLDGETRAHYVEYSCIINVPH